MHPTVIIFLPTFPFSIKICQFKKKISNITITEIVFGEVGELIGKGMMDMFK
jgi:hypothetical protein